MVLPQFSFMAKHFRFKLKFKIPSFQLICCSKRFSTVPSIYRLSPMNPKARDIGHPHLSPPPPPPSTPEYQFMVPKIKFKSNNSSSNHPHIVQCESTFCNIGRNDIIKDKKVIKSKGITSISSRALTSDLVNSNYELDKSMEEESESLLSCFNSFSEEFCHNENHEILEAVSPHTRTKLRTSTILKPHQLGILCTVPLFFNNLKPKKELIVRQGEKKNSTTKAGGRLEKRARPHTSTMSKPQQVGISCTKSTFFNNHTQDKDKLNVREGKKKHNPKKVGGELEKRQMEKGMVSRPSMTQHCTVERMVKESFALVKKSNDPYEDFKKSMMEMMMEMEVFEGEELERLLQCFLDLNSRCYHGVIERVFMDIWQQLFDETRIS